MPYTDKDDRTYKPQSLAAYAQAYKAQQEALNYATQGVLYKHASIHRFIDWCEERGIDKIEQITRPTLQRYQRYLHHATSRSGKPLTTASQRNRLSAIRSWFRYLMRENLILTNPASEMELPKKEKRLPKHALTIEEAEQVLLQPDTTTWQGIRDRAMMELLYSTGIRRLELINLELHDVNAGAGVIAVRQGKGRKDRFVPIGERALHWLKRYSDDVRWQHQTGLSPENVFLNERTGGAMKAARVGHMVKRYVKASGVDKVGSCHLFRHTMATVMLENGADIRFIQQMLGHTLLSTTEIYTHVTVHKLKDVHTLTHPARLAKDKQDLLKALELEAEDMACDEYG